MIETSAVAFDFGFVLVNYHIAGSLSFDNMFVKLVGKKWQE